MRSPAPTGPPDDDQALDDKPVHERSVLSPAILIADATLVVPGRPVNQGAEEVRHTSAAR